MTETERQRQRDRDTESDRETERDKGRERERKSIKQHNILRRFLEASFLNGSFWAMTRRNEI